MSTPHPWLVAGPNGAGRTTLTRIEPFRTLLEATHFVNPDDLALARLLRLGYTEFANVPADVLRHAFVASADEAFSQVSDAIRRDETVCVETVLSTEKYLPLVEITLNRGGCFSLIYIALRAPELACERVSARARSGGHDVPRDRVMARWHRSLEHLPVFARRATAFWIYDNSDSKPDSPPPLLAEGQDGHAVIHHPCAIPQVTLAFKAMS